MAQQILFGTGNPAKLQILREFLAPVPIEVLGPADLGIDLEVEEDGRTPEENAEKKARAYFAASGQPTLAIDAALYIERFPPARQPGVLVRRIGGADRDVSDREILAHYLDELNRVGGESAGLWYVAVAFMARPDRVTVTHYSLPVHFISQASETLIPGTALSSIMIDPPTGRYYSEMPNAERPDAHRLCEMVQQFVESL